MIKLSIERQLSTMSVGTPVIDVSASNVPSAFLQMLTSTGVVKLGATVS